MQPYVQPLQTQLSRFALAYRVAARGCPHAFTFSRNHCSAAEGTEEASPPRRKKVRKPDLPHVVRRKGYRDDISKLRKEFTAETGASKEPVNEMESTMFSEEELETRRSLKRSKAEAGYAAALEVREKQRAERAKRRARDHAHWQARCHAIDARRLEIVARLNEAAAEWVTEDNLTLKVDALLDDFFIDEEAAEHARGGVKTLECAESRTTA